SAAVIASHQVFWILTATVIASNAIGSSIYSTPFAWHCSISFFAIGRDASQISSLPSTKFLNPPPVPDLSTLICTPALSARNSSAIACVNLKTVLEPSISILPVAEEPEGFSAGVGQPEKQTTKP